MDWILWIALVLLGVIAAGLAVLMGLDYLSLRGTIAEDAQGVFRSSVIKSLGLSGLYFLGFVLFGVLCLRSKGSR